MRLAATAALLACAAAALATTGAEAPVGGETRVYRSPTERGFGTTDPYRLWQIQLRALRSRVSRRLPRPSREPGVPACESFPFCERQPMPIPVADPPAESAGAGVGQQPGIVPDDVPGKGDGSDIAVGYKQTQVHIPSATPADPVPAEGPMPLGPD
jgi:hypothetical protein